MSQEKVNDKRKKYSKSKGRNRRDRNDEEKESKGGRTPVFTTREKQNNPEWWMRYPQMAKDAGNLAYAWPTGPNYSNNPGGTVPFGMVLRTQICPGISKDQNSPVNVAARRYYSTIRQANSGAKNYDSQDVIMYFLAMDSIYAFISHLMRAYGLINVYSAENRTIPKFMLEGMGLDYTDLCEHIPDLRTYINTLIYKAASFAVPMDMGIFERHIQLFGNVYLDWANARGQFYAYVPEKLFLFDEATGSDIATAIPTSTLLPSGNRVSSFADLTNFGNTLINAIYGYETASLMSGDILKAYGDKIIKLAPMDWDYRLEPGYSEEMLIQIHNTTVVGSPTSSINIVQDASGTYLIYDPHFSLPTSFSSYASNFDLDDLRTYAQGDSVIDLPLSDVSVDINMVATCDIAPIDWSHTQDTTPYYALTSARTEFVTSVGILSTAIGSNTWIISNADFQITPAQYTTVASLSGAVNFYAKLSKFDWAPRLKMLLISTNGSTTQGTEAIWDMTKYALVNDDIIDRMHEVALLSAFVSPASTYLV